MIDYTRTNVYEIVNSMVQKYYELTKITIKPADPMYSVLLWFAYFIAQTTLAINETAKLNIPSYSYGEYLDTLCTLFYGITRTPAEPAKVDLRFALPEPSVGVTIIPPYTLCTADNSVAFSLDNAVSIANGETAGNGTATAQINGVGGNGYAVGTVNKFIGYVNFSGTVANTSVSSGGAETETDAQLRERIKNSLSVKSTAGAVQTYKFYALSANSGISDVEINSPSAGVVDIYVLMRGGILPDTIVLQDVSNTVNTENVRPLTDTVNVYSAIAQTYNVDLTYYLDYLRQNESTKIIAQINAAVDNFISWQCETMGRSVNNSKLIQMIMDAGAKNVSVRSPAYSDTPYNAVALAGNISVINGGFR
jgi:phage-related baseplate assembly protein